jgi:hypothetical protein
LPLRAPTCSPRRRISQNEEDGVKFKHLAFSDGGAKEITLLTPVLLGLVSEAIRSILQRR